MGRTSSIDDLPEDIRDQLTQRLLESMFSDYDHHAEWLSVLGFSLSKSAIHRFGQAIEKQMSDPGLRLSCAQVASRYSDATSIIGNASSLLMWVVTRHN